ncbi:hypothetical protein DPMN_181518 [Dreissena polymorpha]|uniref:Uncharacterized protein n=1 Tax=Dreissena polymorpha TaxID=45954 RepID=A0A9D4DDX2_DREPO|nr:hypothetical protein DPMN_181518 [Dreissena polymorpha]
MQKGLDEPEITLKEPHSIRWLRLQNAVEAVYFSYLSSFSTLSCFAEEGNAIANGLLKYFINYKTVLLVAFMLDVHEELRILRKRLQEQSLQFSDTESYVDGFLGKLQNLKFSDGQRLKEMKAMQLQ